MAKSRQRMSQVLWAPMSKVRHPVVRMITAAEVMVDEVVVSVAAVEAEPRIRDLQMHSTDAGKMLHGLPYCDVGPKSKLSFP